MTRIDKSALFIRYNAARRMVREGVLDAERVNRALGVAQSADSRPYNTTHEVCTCPDWTYRVGPKGGRCKHQIALALQAGVAR